MNLDVICAGPFEVNCLIIPGGGQQALVIDPGADAGKIRHRLMQLGLTPAAYLLTHGHADHLCALAELHATLPAPVYLHQADQAWAFSPMNQIPPYYPMPVKPDTILLHPGEGVLEIAGQSIRCIETPGHTPGCVCYLFEKQALLISGDTLFKDSCGRTDLPGGDSRTLTQSLKKLAALPDDTIVHAGHGDPTTIGREKQFNFFLQQAARNPA